MFNRDKPHLIYDHNKKVGFNNDSVIIYRKGIDNSVLIAYNVTKE